ncbi:hypothetical protein [Oenococcus oeni]|uniref:hypothetical protein n=1 Tax=Oenococcus oeni TaxID=1247 RepID=UPI001376BAD2|nr:hypothetical protein [Oenococcus oeni]
MPKARVSSNFFLVSTSGYNIFDTQLFGNLNRQFSGETCCAIDDHGIFGADIYIVF